MVQYCWKGHWGDLIFKVNKTGERSLRQARHVKGHWDPNHHHHHRCRWQRRESSLLFLILLDLEKSRNQNKGAILRQRKQVQSNPATTVFRHYCGCTTAVRTCHTHTHGTLVFCQIECTDDKHLTQNVGTTAVMAAPSELVDGLV